MDSAQKGLNDTLLNEDNETYNVHIISITGAVVYKSDFISNTAINVSELAKGIYFITITNNNSSYTSKWIKN